MDYPANPQEHHKIPNCEIKAAASEAVTQGAAPPAAILPAM